MLTLSDYILNKVPLYYTPEKELYYIDFIKAFEKMKIKNGDTILVHSDILSFGKPKFDNFNLFLSVLSKIFIDLVGDKGNVIMPTFSFSFTKNEDYNIQNSPSSVGALTNYFRQIKGAIRTRDPIHSVAIKGLNSREFSIIGNDCFGVNSIYGLLHSIDAKIMTFGTKFADNCFFHYIEQSLNVPYRFNKKFSGFLHDFNRKEKITFNYFVRDLKKNIKSDVSRFNNDLLEKKYLKKEDIGRSSIFCINSKLFFSEGIKALNKDINYFLLKN